MGSVGTYELTMVMRTRLADRGAMKKRALAALLWFYAIWYAGAMVAHVMGLSPVLGPILGTAAAAIIAGDPRRMIWTRAIARDEEPAASAAGQQISNPA